MLLSDIKAPKGSITIECSDKSQSPKISLQEGDVGSQWLEKVRQKIKTADEETYRFAPETEIKCLIRFVGRLIDRLEQEKTIQIWEVCRELRAEQYPYRDADFNHACICLFG